MTGAVSGVALLVPLKGARITGLRLVGNLSTTAIGTFSDSVEVDNCEIYGFKDGVYLGFGDGHYIHHNYIHNVDRALVCGTSKSVLEANMIDFCTDGVFGETDTSSYFEARYNLFLEHIGRNSIRRIHNDENYSADDRIYNNTFRYDAYVRGCVCGIYISGLIEDTTYIYSNWFYGVSTDKCIKAHGNLKIENNSFTEQLPEGLEGRIPTAKIVANKTSGNAPLTVIFKPTGSFDSNGEIKEYHWNFGDGQVVRHGNVSDSVIHTFSSVGKYCVELMVKDNDGCVDKKQISINTLPSDGRNYLSLWVKEDYKGTQAGICTLSVVAGWGGKPPVWKKDVKDISGWQHLVLDITDYFEGDSTYIGVRAITKGDSIPISVIWDNISVTGANISDGDFEDVEPHTPVIFDYYKVRPVVPTDWFFRANANDYWVYWVNGTDGYPYAGDVRSGNRSFVFKIPKNVATETGTKPISWWILERKIGR